MLIGQSSGLALRTQGWLFAAAGAVAFSGKAIVAKLMYRLGADAFAVVGLRMVMAFPLFLAMAWWAGSRSGLRDGTSAGHSSGPLSPHQRWQIVGLGFSGYYLASTLDFLGLQYISASLERAILYLNPTIVLLLSAWWLRHAVKPAQLAAMGLSYAGVVIVWLHDWDAARLVSAAASNGGTSAVAAISLGSICVFLSALSYAIYLIGSGQLVQTLGSMRLVGMASSVACVMVVAQWIVVYAATDGRVASIGHLPWQAWALSALNATICTVLPVWMVMRAVQLIGASAASQVGMVGPLSTIWMAALWLGEPVTWSLIVGTAAVLAGMLVLARVGKPSSAHAASEADKRVRA